MFSKKFNTKKVITWTVLILTVLILEIIFSRSIIFHNDSIWGDNIDGRLNSLFMEHWYKVFRNKETIRNLPIFYPVKNTLGYSDTLFLLSLPYSVLRVFGISWLTAYQLTLIMTHLFGGICLAWFLKRSLKLPLWACIIGLIIGNFSNSYLVKIAHTQFFTHSLVPLLLIFLYNFYNSFSLNLQKKRMIYGILSIFLLAGIFLTSFYVGFFTAFFLLVVNIVIAIYLLKINPNHLKEGLKIIKIYKIEIITYIIIGIVALIPFLWIYLPAFKEMGARNLNEVAYYSPYWYDFFNVSTTNIIWPFPSTIYELQVGYPLITGIILIIGCVYFIKQSSAGSLSLTGNGIRFFMVFGFSFAIAIISLLILKMDLGRIVGILGKAGIFKISIFKILENKIKRIGEIGFSFWYFVYYLMPGASALRAIARFNQFLSLPAGIVIAVFLSERIRIINKNYIKYFLICIVITTLIFVEHQNNGKRFNWTKSQINNYLEETSVPPQDCESFLLVNNTVPRNAPYQLDAWIIANKYNIKTINGYSGQFPKNWSYIWDMDTNRNYGDILQWIDEYNLKNVYLYDYKNDNWIKYTEAAIEELYDVIIGYPELRLNENIVLARNKSIYQGRGWSWPGEFGAWTDGETITLQMSVDSVDDLLLDLNISNIFFNDPIDVYINNVFIGRYEFVVGNNVIRIPKEVFPDKKLKIHFYIKDPKPQVNDGRKLGIELLSFYLLSADIYN